jgi:hypothetical protein
MADDCVTCRALSSRARWVFRQTNAAKQRATASKAQIDVRRTFRRGNNKGFATPPDSI